MFPTIHNYTGDTLKTQGYGALSDCISCEVTEVLNGEFTLELTYPLNGLHSEYLIPGNIIEVKPNHNQERQPFRISEVKKTFSNNIKVSANHISYDLSGYPVRAASYYGTLMYLFDQLNEMTWDSGDSVFHKFNFDTDMRAYSYDPDNPDPAYKPFSMAGVQTLRSWMGGQDGSIIDVYGGEWVYDNFNVFLTKRRGKDTGIRISYGKNIAEYEKQREYATYSHICAYWKKSDDLVYSDLMSTGIECPFRCAYYDATNEFEEKPSSTQLNATATAQVSKTKVDVQTITVTPAQIGNDNIGLGDGVLICYESVFSTRVVKTVWDALTETYIKLELGTKKVNITDTIKSLTTGPNGSSGGGSGGGVDYVIEQGSSGIWSYRKWWSGIAECWSYYQPTKTGRSTTMLGLSGYVYETGSISLPFTFATAPTVTFSGNVGAQNTVIAYSRCTASDCAVEMVSASGTRTMNISIYVIGRYRS